MADKRKRRKMFVGSVTEIRPHRPPAKTILITEATGPGIRRVVARMEPLEVHGERDRLARLDKANAMRSLLSLEKAMGEKSVRVKPHRRKKKEG